MLVWRERRRLMTRREINTHVRISENLIQYPSVVRINGLGDAYPAPMALRSSGALYNDEKCVPVSNHYIFHSEEVTYQVDYYIHQVGAKDTHEVKSSVPLEGLE